MFEPSLTAEAHFHLMRRVAVRIGLRPGGRFAPPPVPMLNIGAPVPLGIPNGPPAAATGLAPANENAAGAPPLAAFEPVEKLNAGGGDAAAVPNIPPPAAVGAAVVG